MDVQVHVPRVMHFTKRHIETIFLHSHTPADAPSLFEFEFNLLRQWKIKVDELDFVYD